MTYPHEPPDVPSGNPMVVPGGEGPPVASRGPAWLQFPRRAILLIAACVVTIFFLRMWPVPGGLPAEAPGPPLRALISAPVLENLPGSLLLLAAAFAVALLLALVLAAAGAILAWLSSRSPRTGALLSALGRLAVFTWMPLPVVLSAFLLLLLLVTSGAGATFGIVGDNAYTLLWGAILTALYPALLAAQDAMRLGESAVARGKGHGFLAALLQLGQSLLLQTAGFLSALTVVEMIFARPGVGGLLLNSVFRLDFVLMIDILIVMALLVLAGRLLAELLGWFRRLLLGIEKPSGIPSERAPRRWWTMFAALLLLLPLGLVVMGLLTAPQAAAQQDLQQRLATPSLQHPLGTDALGRDLWARLRLGGLSTLARASLLAGAVLLPALALGVITGSLYRRGGWLGESLADLLFLPVDALLFLPVIPAAVVYSALIGPGENRLLVLGLALLFLPRVARAARDMWRRRHTGNALRDLLTALAALFLLALFHGFVTLLSIEYLGFGPPPPAPSLGMLLAESQQHLLATPGAIVALVVVVGLLAFALYTAAAAIADFVDTRRPLVRLNE